MSDTTAPALEKRSHPKGLYVLFMSEAWERFSFYGMRGLLVLYLTSQLNYGRSEALGVYATYAGLVYLTPILGGYLADKVLGARKAIIIGGVLMALGHLAMSFEPALFVGMGLIIAGNGFFKPNISTIVGSLYEENDPRRDGGFTIFYMGINLGAFFAPLICGYLGEKVGWHWGFSAATIGMIIGVLSFIYGQRWLGSAGFPPGVEANENTRLTSGDWRDIVFIIAAAILIVGVVLAGWHVAGPVWNEFHPGLKLLTVAVIIGGLIGLQRLRNQRLGKTSEPLTKDELKSVGVLAVIYFFVLFFWMGFEQAGGTMNLFAMEQTDRHLWAGGWEMPASWFQAVNPFYIMILAPIFSRIWTVNDRNASTWGLSTPGKMGWGMIVLGLGFIVMYFGQQSANDLGKAGLGWLLAVYLLHTIGELCLSPIGLSVITKLSPPRIVSLMMGLWFGATALSDYLAGKLESILHTYQLPLWEFLICSSIGAGIALLLITPFLKKWIKGRA